MPNVQMIQATLAPKAKAVATDAIKMTKSAPAAKEVAAHAADAMDAQGKAMVNMQKKAYVKPEMKTIEIESDKTILTGSSSEPWGPKEDPFEFEE